MLRTSARAGTGGFSLIELMIVVAMIAVAATFATASLGFLNAGADADAAVARLIDAIGFARRTAIAINEPVAWCPATPDEQACGQRDDWHHGSLIFVDSNANHRRDPDETVLRHVAPLASSTARWYWRSFRSRADLTMAADGTTDWQNGSFLFCPDGVDTTHARLVVLNAAGRTRIATDNDGDGVVENPSGEPVVCPG